jgi:hypothetical protein
MILGFGPLAAWLASNLAMVFVPRIGGASSRGLQWDGVISDLTPFMLMCLVGCVACEVYAGLRSHPVAKASGFCLIWPVAICQALFVGLLM